MKIGVLGTGVVGQTIGGALAKSGHDVVIGTRDPAKTLANADPGPYGMPPFRAWASAHPTVKVATFSDAAQHGEVIINATSGAGALDALVLAGATNLNGKILLDITNPLDFSHGMPPTLTVSNTDSLGEQIQRAFPDVKVVKTLNTMTAALMVNPQQLADGDHAVFVSGNDTASRAKTAQYLADWFGWRQIIDLGDITSARGTEMYLPLWLRMMGALGTPIFNVKIVK